MVQARAFFLYMLDKIVKGMQIDVHTTCILVRKRLYYIACSYSWKKKSIWMLSFHFPC